MSTAFPLPALPDVPEFGPVTQLPELVVLNASLASTVIVCSCSPALPDN